MKFKEKLLMCSLPLMLFIQGCSDTQSETDDESSTSDDSFASMYFNTSEMMHCYKDLNGKTAVLDYESMETSLLCNKPNCHHTTDRDCIVNRLNGNVPMFSGTYAYYFIDDYPEITDGEDGKPFLKLGSTLYRFDMKNYSEEKLLYVDGVSVSMNCYGWLLHDGTIYFVGNHYNTKTDENGFIKNWGNTGGEMELYSIDLSTKKIQNYGDLYNVTELTKYHPLTSRSGEVYMKGVFDNRIYFQVAFSGGEGYLHYVKYFDLSTKKFVGDPTDYENIDFCSAAFVSNDYLVITRKGQADIYKAGQEQPITIQDMDIIEVSYLAETAFDDKLFLYSKVYDLNTMDCISLPNRENTVVIAAYRDNYIVSKENGQGEFDKIPKKDYLAG